MIARVRSDPLTALIGPSGTGKSSLIRASAIPALERSGEGWQALVVRPGRRPVAALAAMLIQLGADSSTRRPGTEADDDRKLSERLIDEPGDLGARLRLRARKQQRCYLVNSVTIGTCLTEILAPQPARVWRTSRPVRITHAPGSPTVRYDAGDSGKMAAWDTDTAIALASARYQRALAMWISAPLPSRSSVAKVTRARY